jgi:hypothetical protein
MGGVFEKIIVTIAGAFIFWFAGLIPWGRPKSWWQIWRLRSDPGVCFTIVVAKLEGDKDGAQTRHVIESLRHEFAPVAGGPQVHIAPFPEALTPGPGEVTAADAAAEKKGRKWLKRVNADLLVWGSVAKEHALLRLRFLPREGSGAGSTPYSLSDKLELPADFGADLGAVLAVSAAAAINPIFEQQGRALAAVIEPVARKLAPLAANPPASFSGETKASLWSAYAMAERQVGKERGDNARLETAIAYFRKALTERPRERIPLDWAMTQNNLGTALRSLGELENGTGRLEEAATAFREALKERTRERVPLDWAATQNNLGNALSSLGERESGTEKLKEAAAAFREALKERTRERVPLKWATTQNNLGDALRCLGERQANQDRAKGCATLKESRAALAMALAEFIRSGASRYESMARDNLRVLDEAETRIGCGVN